ncbi:hypothetical protein VTJ04DRAFT_1573 [Mycothermus thermophilus]|uniref:uncharacterized protein n=1 Tax=Humicola insolens TaxID=85995 RepID=UPI0037440D58
MNPFPFQPSPSTCRPEPSMLDPYLPLANACMSRPTNPPIPYRRVDEPCFLPILTNSRTNQTSPHTSNNDPS